jgi:hypothetical protein
MDVWHMSVSYTGTDWIIRAQTGTDAHSIGLGDRKITRQVDGAEDGIIDDDSVVELAKALIETVMRFTGRLSFELLGDQAQEELGLLLPW